MRHHQKIHDDQAAEIDLTPMLDVVFIMLIFFIVTATFIKEVSLTLDRPDKNQQVSTDTKTEHMMVKVHADNQIVINDLYIDKYSLRAYFQSHQAKNPEAIVIIKAHNKSKTAILTTISDAANAAGMKGVSLDNVDKF
ncbi:MAG: biopolymer transport protein ExbD [Pseudohongiellaceae bacterium]|jgi:biopolymer transport protein ExbD